MKRRLETAGRWTLRALAWTLVVAVGWLVGGILVRGLPALSWEFLTTGPTDAGAGGGILPAIVGTVGLTVLTALLALPIGMGAAIWLAEYARDGAVVRLVRLGVLTLAGVPSIVFGLFGLGLFVVFLGLGTSMLAGALTLAFMILPVIIVASEEALRAVPAGLREASLALGATRWQTIRHQLLPVALSGMLTGSILGISRAAGETAPILFTAAVFFRPGIPKSPMEPVMALPYHLYILATQHPDAPPVRLRQFGTALVLLLLVLGVNSSAIVLRNRYRPPGGMA